MLVQCRRILKRWKRPASPTFVLCRSEPGLFCARSLICRTKLDPVERSVSFTSQTRSQLWQARTMSSGPVRTLPIRSIPSTVSTTNYIDSAVLGPHYFWLHWATPPFLMTAETDHPDKQVPTGQVE